MKIQTYFLEKFSDQYLMKIKTCFCFRKFFRFVINENTDLFLFQNNFQIRTK